MKKVLPLVLSITISCLLVYIAYFNKDIFLNDAIFGIPELMCNAIKEMYYAIREMYYAIREMFL